MAQHTRPERSDNRGGHKKKTTTKKMFTHRVEESKHEELHRYADKLNEEVKNGIPTFTISEFKEGAETFTPSLKLSWCEAKLKIENLRQKFCGDKTVYFEIVKNEPCNTTEK